MRKFYFTNFILLTLLVGTISQGSENLGKSIAHLPEVNLEENYNIRRFIRSSLEKDVDPSEKNRYFNSLDYLHLSENYKGDFGGSGDSNLYLATFEKRLKPNEKIAFFIGGGDNKIKFDQPIRINRDIFFAGGYHFYEFSNKIAVTSILSYNHSHDSIHIQNNSSTSPSMSLSFGSHLSYPIPNEYMNLYLNGGIDWAKIYQGTYSNGAYSTKNNTEYYDSVRPTVGISGEKSFLLQDKKATLKLSTNYEKEIGNIRDKKVLWNNGVRTKVDTLDRDDIVNIGVNADINLTENLDIGASYNKLLSKDYDADLYGANFTYSLDKPMLEGFDYFNTLDKEKRFRVSSNFMLETEDYDDNTTGTAGSTSFSPRLILSVTDKKGDFVYLMDTFYKTEDWFGGRKEKEGKDTNRRINPQINWKGVQVTDNLKIHGYIGWRNQVRKQTDSKGTPWRNVTDSYRIAPAINYTINKNVAFLGSTLLAMDEISDSRDNYPFTHNYWAENIYGFRFILNKNWILTSNIYRLDKKYMGNNNKTAHSTQFRPVVRYNFVDGSFLQLQGRFSLTNGERVENRQGIVAQYNEETRYTATVGYKVTDYFSTYAEVAMNSVKRTKDSDKSVSRINRILGKVGFIYILDI